MLARDLLLAAGGTISDKGKDAMVHGPGGARQFQKPDDRKLAGWCPP